MHNFNNKNDLHNRVPSLGEVEWLPSCETIHVEDLEQKEVDATRCLLFLSELEQSDKKKMERANDPSDISVAPWVSSSSKVAEARFINKSKTSILLPAGAGFQPDSKVKLGSKSYERSAVMRSKEGKRQTIRVLRKNSEAIKNSYSAIARYNDCSAGASAKNISEEESSADYNVRKSCYSLYNNNKNVEPNGNKNSRRDKENDCIQLITCLISKPEYGSQALVLSKKGKSYMQCADNSGKPPLKQNMNIGNRVSVRDFEADNCKMKQKTEECLPSDIVNTDPFRKTAYKMSGHTQNADIKSLANILKPATNEATAWQCLKIKKKIMQSIQKQSVIRTCAPAEPKSSSKLLGKYFKQSQSKGRKRVTGTSYVNKTEVLDFNYESYNPFTKHLYEKYRLLLSKNK